MFWGWQTRVGLSASCAILLTCVLSLPVRAAQVASDGDGARKTTTGKRPARYRKISASADKNSDPTSKPIPPRSSAPGKRSSHKKKTAKTRGQQRIDPERAQAIQQALIRQHYLSGEPSGAWNQQSEDAMRRYQADNGWQSKTVPDSRALIKLGLGPSKDHLLNPESAMTTVPDEPKTSPLPTTSNRAGAGAQPVAPSSSATPVSAGSPGPQ